MSVSGFHVPAFAKLNLTLEVLRRRQDGFHEVKTILQTTDLSDRLEVQPYHTLRVECDDPFLAGEANLVWQAAVALAKHCNRLPKAFIFIQKQIPVGMGLGGGSSDAAAALQALNRLWGLGMTLDELSQVGAGLGSDVPFFLWGGTALAEGRGEKIKPLPPLPRLPVTLVCPDSTIPNKTARLYSSLTPEHYSDGSVTGRLEETLRREEFVESSTFNVFEQVAFTVFPQLALLRQRFEASIAGRAHLSGAGPALFYIPSDKEEHRRVAAALQTYPAKVYFVHTITPDPRRFRE